MQNRKYSPLFPLIFVVTTAITLYFFGERWLRAILLYLSTAVWAQTIISKTGLGWRVAGRFVAGETIADAIHTTKMLNAQGLDVTINYLGEHVYKSEEALAARDEIEQLLTAVHQNGVNANISIKPSQLGLNIDPNLLYQNLHELLTYALSLNNKIRIDMEESSTVDTTLSIYRKLRDEDGFGNHVGVVIQAYLYRSEDDIVQLAANGGWVRLCKGAYAEPPEVAFPAKTKTDVNYIKLAQMLLSDEARTQGGYVGFATHDEKMIQAILGYVDKQNIPTDSFEFQMLFGVRRDLQEQLVKNGYRVRVYVPYGTAWYAYFMRRLAERPANLWFFISNILRP